MPPRNILPMIQTRPMYETLLRTLQPEPSAEPPLKPDFASTLPFDILSQIFEWYLSQETPLHPVETLLLVCRSWHRVALECSRLWSTFSIRLDAFRYWVSCIPRRLSLCAPHSLLDIHIRVGRSTDMIDSRDLTVFHKHQKDLLSVLIGDKGEIARRWRNFIVIDEGLVDSPYTFDSPMAQYCTFPTPNLQELRLTGFNSSLPVFPVTPKLNTFIAASVRIPFLPNLSAASEVTVCTGGSQFDEGLAAAVNVMALRISLGEGKSYGLSTIYPKLTSLALVEGIREKGLDGLSAPALQELSIHFSRESEYLTTVSCKGIPFQQLQKLSISIAERIRDPSIKSYSNGLCEILWAAKNIQVLELSRTVTEILVLKLLTNECESLYQDHTVLVAIRGARESVAEIRDGAKDNLLDWDTMLAVIERCIVDP